MSPTPPTAQEFKDNARKSWSEAAAGWKRWWPTIEAGAQSLSDRLIELAEVEPGDRVLDVATGIGEPALSAARRGAFVVGTDLAPEMITLARERARELGIANAEFRELDAEALELPPASFDAAICRWCLMLLRSPELAVAGIQRALKPGARFAAAVWGGAGKVPFLEIPTIVAQRELAQPVPPPGTPGPLSMGRPGQLESLFKSFEDVRTEVVAVTMKFDSVEHYITYLSDRSLTLKEGLAQADDAARARARRAIAEATQPHVERDGRVRIVNEVRCVSGRNRSSDAR